MASKMLAIKLSLSISSVSGLGSNQCLTELFDHSAVACDWVGFCLLQLMKGLESFQ